VNGGAGHSRRPDPISRICTADDSVRFGLPLN
jgi:hypothetical protein